MSTRQVLDEMEQDAIREDLEFDNMTNMSASDSDPANFHPTKRVKPPQSYFESILEDINNQLLSLGINRDDPVSAVRSAYQNREKIKEQAISKLDVLQDIITEFNKSYNDSKFKAIDEVLAKEDYLEDLKTSIAKMVDIDKDEGKPDPSKTTNTDKSHQTPPGEESKTNSDK
jgi:hypothetical protein